MANPLFNALGGGNMPNPLNNMKNMVQQFNQFRQSFKGNPREVVMNMVNSGQISQEQLNTAQQAAQQFKQFLNK